VKKERDLIYGEIYKKDSYDVESTAAVYVRRIRVKIEINSKDPKYLKVVCGIGYKVKKL
jgi:DNA-binding response OmpR family regulator